MRYLALAVLLATCVSTALGDTAVIKADNDETDLGMVVVDIQSDGAYLDVGSALSDNNHDSWCLIANYDRQVSLIGWKGMFDAIPQITSRDNIISATLKVYQRGPVGDETIKVNRVTSQWLAQAAGSNESVVTGVHRLPGGEDPYWAAGASTGFGSGDYTTEDEAQFSFTEYNYGKDNYVVVTEMVKDMYDSGNQGFVLRQISGTADPYMQGDEQTQAGDDGYYAKPALYITYSADVTPHHLTVNSGSGDGDYTVGTVVPISAGAAPAGQGFSVWVGDVAGVTDVHSSSTNLQMPTTDVEVTATYAAIHTLTVNSGSGDGSYVIGSTVEIGADSAPVGYAFDQWVGDTSALDSPSASVTDVTMPDADVQVTATYIVASGYYLTVNSGTGSGTYMPGTVVNIVAGAAPAGKEWNMWGWDYGEVADFEATSTTFTMPDKDAAITATYRNTGAPEDWWPWYHGFCKRNFGAEIEPLAYEMHGTDLVFMSRSGSEWSHVSKNSACVAFETNLPAETYVEYGLTTSYGSETDQSDNHYYLHLHYLRNLSDDTTYHYRYVATDERGNTIYSPDKTFTTATPANVVYVPGGLSGPPYTLNQSGKTYLLTQDLVCNRTAFNVTTSNVTLDLGGHTVIYNEEDYQVSSNYIDTAAFGVKSYGNDSNVNILNGTIVQGAGYNQPANDGMGYNPVFFYHGTGDIAGITADYTGCQLSGIFLHYATGMDIHHNVVIDHGIDIDDRESGISGIREARSIHHNLLKRVRQGGLQGCSNGEAYANEIYVDSCGTNSFGIGYYKDTDAECHANRIFGTGYLVVALGTVSAGVADINLHDNYIHLQAIAPDDRWDEYGAQSGAYCSRITWGGDNIDYHDNVMVTYGRDGGMVRGTWFHMQPGIVDCVFRNNICKAVLQDTASSIQGCIVHVGDSSTNDPPLVYENNRLISNFCNARMGEDYYGAGCNAEFYDNTFVKEGPTRSDYRTIGVGYGTKRSSGHKFFDSLFEGGASYDEVRWDGTGIRDYYVGWTLTVQTDDFADISIEDVFNSVVYTGQSDIDGLASTLLYEYFAQPSGRTYHTPHDVTVTKGVDSVTESVTVDAKKTVEIWLAGGYDLTVTNGSGSGVYDVDEVVPISANAAPSGKMFAIWTGDYSYLADRTQASTTVTMPAADVSVTASYAWAYVLTVNSGNGDGQYFASTVVSIDADAAPAGTAFDGWVGDTTGIADTGQASTTITMPSSDTEITATYASLGIAGDLNSDGWVGQPDLDIVLDQWGRSGAEITDPRADADDSGWVGQPDLDIVLDDWGKSI